MKKVITRLTLCGAVLLLHSGCSTLQKSESAKSGGESWTITSLWKKEYQTPNSLAVIWSPDVLAVAGKPPTRGFGGRIFFYNDKSQAIPVEGDVIVHGYLGDPARGTTSEADKTFAFTAEQLTEHFSPSQLGASYSIWIPWDEAGGYQEQITLIPSFKSKVGLVVQGAPAKLMLPGKTPEKNLLSRKNSLPTQTVSYRQSTTPTNMGFELPRLGTTMQVTTIDVPKNASLARSPGKKTFELGRGPQKIAPRQQETNEGTGVSVGGGKSISPQSPAPLDRQPLNEKLPLPGVPVVGKSEPIGPPAVTTEELDQVVESMTKPRVHSLPPPARNPFVRQELPNVSNMVRQASFNRTDSN